MKYEKKLEQYKILENDGTGPFGKNVQSILIAYENQKPINAILVVDTSDEDTICYAGAIMRDEKDPSKLAKIVDFFNKK